MVFFHRITSRLAPHEDSSEIPRRDCFRLVQSTKRYGDSSERSMQNQCKPYGDSSERSVEKLFWFSSIYKAMKGLAQKLCGVFNYLKKPRKEAADPLLPIQNQASASLDEPLLLPPVLSAEESSQSVSTTISFGALTDSSIDGEIVEEESSPSMKRSSVVVNKEKRIKHYSSRHKILLVGEGDFSFSACLAVAFGGAANIIATSLDSQAFLKKNYGNAMSNIAELTSRGGRVMHGIDATEMANHEFLRQLRFDRIIFNFPHAGFLRESTERQLRRHRKLVSRFLMNAKKMISEDGEIHISHKTNGFHAEFKVESIASSHGLRLIEAVKFKCGNYPGYNTKYGFGGDKNFNPYPSKTFKLGLKPS